MKRTKDHIRKREKKRGVKKYTKEDRNVAQPRILPNEGPPNIQNPGATQLVTEAHQNHEENIITKKIHQNLNMQDKFMHKKKTSVEIQSEVLGKNKLVNNKKITKEENGVRLRQKNIHRKDVLNFDNNQ